MNQGDYTATATQQPTYASATVFAQTAKDPVWFISAAESYLMQAEALERYYGGTGALAMYQNGVRAAFTQVGLATTSVPAAYLLYSGTFDQKLEKIIVQKWASFAGSHSLEGFFEQERTGYPKTSTVYSTDASYIPGQWVYSKNGVTAGLFPKRLVYPASSRDRNSNTPAEVPITTKVWWGK